MVATIAMSWYMLVSGKTFLGGHTNECMKAAILNTKCLVKEWGDIFSSNSYNSYL